MTKVVGVRFKDTGKTYYFDPQGFDIKKGQTLVVETAKGVECGIAQSGVKEVEDDEIVSPLKAVSWWERILWWTHCGMFRRSSL